MNLHDFHQLDAIRKFSDKNVKTSVPSIYSLFSWVENKTARKPIQ